MEPILSLNVRHRDNNKRQENDKNLEMRIAKPFRHGVEAQECVCSVFYLLISRSVMWMKKAW